MAGIEPYRSQIAVRPTEGPRIQGVQVDGNGNDFAQLGNSVLNAAEPHMAARARAAALEDAGAADLIRDENGNYALPDPPKGGLVYARIYDESIQQRFVTATMLDFESTANETVGNYRDDPQGFLVAMTARAEAKVNAAPAELRADLETRLSREVLERHRGLAEGKARRDYDNAIEAENLGAQANQTEAMRLWMTGTTEGMRQGDEAMARASGNITRLVALGALSSDGGANKAQLMMAQVGNERDYSVSMNTLRAIAPVLKDGSNEELQLMQLALEGVDPYPKEPGKEILPGITFANISEFFPSRQVANQASSLLGGELGRRQQVAADATAERRHQESLLAAQTQADETHKLVVAARNASTRSNFNSTMGYTEEEMVGIETDFGNIHDTMRTPEGRDRYLGMISTYGVMPKTLTDYVNGSINGDQMMPVMNFIASVKQMNVDGNNVGQAFFDDLSPKTRALYLKNEQLIRAGVPENARQGELENFAAKQSFTFEQGIAAVNARAGTLDAKGVKIGGYQQQRAEVIARITGVPLEQVNVSKPVLEMFDEYLPMALQANDGNVIKALEDTANSVKHNFMPHKIFLGGFGPAEWNRFKPRLGDLSDEIRRVAGPSGNPTGAKLTDLDNQNRPRVRIDPLYNAPTRDAHGRPVLGRYRVIYFDKFGNKTGENRVDMDEIVGNVIKTRAHMTERANQIKAEAARKAGEKAGSRWQWVTDPRTGQRAYRLKEGRSGATL